MSQGLKKIAFVFFVVFKGGVSEEYQTGAFSRLNLDEYFSDYLVWLI